MNPDHHLTATEWRKKVDWSIKRLDEGPASWVRLLPLDPSSPDSRPSLLLPGSFNPLHRGHLEMARLASEKTGMPVDFELSINNADKPTTASSEIARRLARTMSGQSADTAPHAFWPNGLVLTNLPKFVDKAAAFPASFFVVGVDTLVRIADVRFYDSSVAQRDEAIKRIVAYGCRFIVFGRVSGNRFLEFRDLDLPGDLISICNAIPGSRFREDVSSSRLRDRPKLHD